MSTIQRRDRLSHSTDDIACWFLDTDYNGESFFVRHAYFCGETDPYERLKRALRADIDEEAWEAVLHHESTVRDPEKREGCCQGHQPLWG